MGGPGLLHFEIHDNFAYELCDMGVGRTYSVSTWMGFPLKSFDIAISPGLLPFFVLVVLCIHSFGSTVWVLTRVLPGFLIKGWAGS